jgi:hypothetical protein
MNIENEMMLPASKDRAIVAKSDFYFTGIPCRRGHIARRYTSSANCVQCIAEKRGKNEILTRGKPRASEENRHRAQAALAAGFSTYIPATPCRSGHRNRFATTHNCADCCSLTQKSDTEKRWRRIEKVYNLSKADFFQMLDLQKGKCPICLSHITAALCHVDHCHESGRVRGLLCQKCNQGLGLFLDSAEIMTSAIQYLEKNK